MTADKSGPRHGDNYVANSTLGRLLRERGPLLAGILAGLIGLVFSFAFKDIIPARPLGDPLPLMLSATSLTRGFLYFQWRAPLFHLFFALAIALLAVVALRVLTGRRPGRAEARFAGRIAAAFNVGVVALLAVDALIVGLWYLMAGGVSVLITGYAAGLAATLWSRFRVRGPDS
jgi:hypothetical protein